MNGDTLIVSKHGESTRIDRMPPMAPAQARSELDHLLVLCQQARLRPLPFGPKTSSAIFDAGRRGRDPREQAVKAWEQQPTGLPGEGDSASARLAWRGQDPFAEGIFDEWRRLAAAVFEPVADWFANTVVRSQNGADGG
jgi:exonuclease V gamma subunit